MYKITLTVPVYNAEKYLNELFESVKKQTIGFENIQVIMVDDCSTDRSKQMMDEYAAKYENVISISLEQNSGIAGKARNKGISLAQGKYLMFADSDDFLPEDACETLYHAIEEKNADFIISNYINTDEDGTLWEKPIFNLEKYQEFKLSITDYTKSFFILNGSACNKIFRKDFVTSHNIKFLEGVPAEDAYFVTYCFMESSNVYYIPKVTYCYRQRNKASATVSTSVSFSRNRKYFKGINIAYRAIYENFKAHHQIRFYRYTYAKNMSYMLYKFIDSTSLTDEERVEILKEMRWFYELSVTLKVPACQKAQQMIVHKIIDEDYEEAINYCKIVADIRTYLPKEVSEDMSRPDADMYRRISEYDEEY
jgi:glycosyltransferase